jgi:hypothetical protein
MKHDVEHFVCIYVKCQNKKSILKKYGMYRILSILNELWENVSMDSMTQLPEWIGCYPCNSWSIFQVGENDFN